MLSVYLSEVSMNDTNHVLSPSGTCSTTAKFDPEKYKSTLEAIDLVASQLAEVKAIRRETNEIRDILSEKYAENLGSNVTSCITQ